VAQSYLFQSIAIENAGVLNSSAAIFLKALGRHISSSNGEERESVFHFQLQIAVTMQRLNAIISHN